MKNFTKLFLFSAFAFLYSEAYSRENNTPVIESLRSNLYLLNSNNSTILADGNLVQYSSSYNGGIDYMDAAKFTNIDESFGLLRDGVLLAIERRPLIAVVDTVFFNLSKTTRRNYQFQFLATLLNHPGLCSTLRDSYTGINTPINLNGTTTLNFSIDSNAASKKPNRFMMLFSSSSIVPVNFTGISAWQYGNVTDVSWSVENELNIKEYKIERSTDGNNFIGVASVYATGVITNGSKKYSWEDILTLPGNCFYRICSVGINGELIYSKIIKVDGDKDIHALSVYPNPLVGTVINLQMSNMAAGIYQVYLLNASGQLLQTNTINHSTGTIAEKIYLDKDIAKGVYQLELCPVNGKKIFVSFIR